MSHTAQTSRIRGPAAGLERAGEAPNEPETIASSQFPSLIQSHRLGRFGLGAKLATVEGASCHESSGSRAVEMETARFQARPSASAPKLLP